MNYSYFEIHNNPHNPYNPLFPSKMELQEREKNKKKFMNNVFRITLLK